MRDNVYTVWSSGPTLGGRVAVFRTRVEAYEFSNLMNEMTKYSPTSSKDTDGVSRAWKMGDGAYWVKEEPDPFENSEYFEWD